MILTIALPESLREQGNQFARCIGMGPDGDKTFSHEAAYQDGAGNRYIVTSGCVVEHFAELATGELVEPEWGADMEAAARAQALIAVWVPPEGDEAPEPFAQPDRIAVVVGDDVQVALAAFGVSRTPIQPMGYLQPQQLCDNVTQTAKDCRNVHSC